MRRRFAFSCTLLLALTLPAWLAAPAVAGRRADCRAACQVAIESCVADRTASLAGEGLRGKRLRRKAGRERRRCRRKAVRQCRTLGVAAACQTPLQCQCS